MARNARDRRAPPPATAILPVGNIPTVRGPMARTGAEAASQPQQPPIFSGQFASKEIFPGHGSCAHIVSASKGPPSSGRSSVYPPPPYLLVAWSRYLAPAPPLHPAHRPVACALSGSRPVTPSVCRHSLVHSHHLEGIPTTISPYNCEAWALCAHPLRYLVYGLYLRYDHRGLALPGTDHHTRVRHGRSYSSIDASP